MEIVKLANNTAEGALKDADQRGLRLLTPEEHEALLQTEDGKKYWGSWYWTSMRMKYGKGATEAEVQIVGEKPEKIFLPLNDGWYTMKSHGLPNGEKSTSENPKARWFYRWQDKAFEGLVARDYSDWDGYVRRNVYCLYRPSCRLGVLATPKKDHKHKVKKICEDCGAIL